MSKRMQQSVQFLRRFLIRNCATLLWFVQEALGYRIAALFVERAVIFSKRAVIRRTLHTFMAKGAAILGLRRFTRRCTAARSSKCGTFVGRKASHMPPCFRVQKLKIIQITSTVLFTQYYDPKPFIFHFLNSS